MPENTEIWQPESLEDLPTSIDWRNKGAVTPVKTYKLDNNECKACWAFAAVDAYEFLHFNITG